MNFFHVHPAHPRNDFVLLSPLDPDRELGLYQTLSHERNYYFCPRCGVRCLTYSGESEIVAVDLTELGEQGEGKREVWRAKWDGQEATEPYVAINGVTIEPREDFDLRLLTEEKRVQYFDGRSAVEDEKTPRWDRPHYWGCY
jgi:hypothetical protein